MAAPIVGPLVHGNILSVCILLILGSLVYANYLLWHEYVLVGTWAFLLSQALFQLRAGIVSLIEDLRKEPKGVKGDPPQTLLAQLQESAGRIRPKQAINALLENSFPLFAGLLLCSVLFHSFSGLLLLIGILISVAAGIGIMLAVFGRKLLNFHMALGLADESAVTIFLVVGFFVMVAFSFAFLGVQTVLEGADALTSSISWIHNTLDSTMKDEGTQRRFAELIEQATAMAEDGFAQARASQNETEWWPVVEHVHDSFKEGRNTTVIVLESHSQLANIYNETAWWPMADQAFGVIVSGDLSSADDLMAQLQELVMPYLTADTLTTVGSSLLGALTNPLAIAVSVFGVIGSVLSFISQWGAATFLFLYFLFTFLTLPSDLMEVLIRLLVPTSDASQKLLAQALRSSLEGVFFLPIQFASSHALVTLLAFSLLGVRFVYFATFLAFVVSLTQMLGTGAYLICIPWSVALIAPVFMGTGGSWFSAIIGVLLFAIHFVGYSMIDDRLYKIGEEKGRVSSPLLTAFSLGLGVAAFGSSGVLFGPLLVSLLLVLMQQELGLEAGKPLPKCLVSVQLDGRPDSRVRVAVPSTESAWEEFVQNIHERVENCPEDVVLLHSETQAEVTKVEETHGGLLLLAHSAANAAGIKQSSAV
eukprot:m.108996 g.108996  ORF g.108996 m.108996 type:complete len:647 (-) comp15950_c0_seq1:67-2007(-)